MSRTADRGIAMAKKSEKTRILVVEDDPVMLGLLKATLESAGYSIEVAADGDEGLKKVECAGGARPDLVILDVVMPKMDGYAVARKIKGNPAYADTPIIMLTAKEQPLDKVTGLVDSEADYYLTKPVNMDDLLTHVMKLMGK